MPHEDVTIRTALDRQKSGNTVGASFEAIGSWWVEGDDKMPFPADGAPIIEFGMRNGQPAAYMTPDDDGQHAWCTPVGGPDAVSVRWIRT